MLLLLTIALVLIGAVALVIGFVQEAMFPIYLSIACSLGAAVVLVLFTRLSRARLAAAPAAAGPADADGPALASDLPISDYDDRRVAEIVPLLGDLDRRDLELVRRHEADGRNRTTILRRIDDLMDEQADGGDDDIDDAGEDTLVGAAAVFGRDSDDDEGDAEDDDSDDGFPIAEYDDLRTAEIIPLLDELTADELEEVADREVDGQNRTAVLDRIDALLGDEDEAPAKKAPAKKKAVASKSTAKKKATAKKAPAKKSSAKKAPAKKKATASKATATKKTAAKKAPAKKKAAASKATAKKSGARKSSR